MARKILYILITLLPLTLKAQFVNQHVLASCGAEYKNTLLNLSFTIGEISIQTYTIQDRLVTQGFQQPVQAAILPIEWVSFTAALNNGSTQLEWTTAHELNNDYFEVQKSPDALDFKVFKVLKGKGTGFGETYKTEDPSPYAGTTYYRLRQVDIDGKFTFSSVVTVRPGIAALAWRAYPNPAAVTVNIHIISPVNQQICLDIYAITGALMFTRQVAVHSGNNAILLNVDSFVPGSYFLSSRNTSLPVITIIKE